MEVGEDFPEYGETTKPSLPVKMTIFDRCRNRVAMGVAFLITCAVAMGPWTAAGNPSGGVIKILTFNIMWEENGVRAGNLSLPVWEVRKALVARLIHQTNADVVGLQEASHEQQAGLRAALPEYTLVYHAATNNTNPILFKTERFRLLKSGALVLNIEPERDGTNIGVRSSTWVHLEDRVNQKRMWLYSLHLDHRSTGPTRQISAVRLMARAQDHADAVFVTGDFNTSESSPTMAYLYGRARLTNDLGELVANSKPLVSAYRALHPESPGRLIDHVLVGPGAGIRQSGRIVAGSASDHDIIWAEVSLE